ncbi:MAG TPA: arylsulfatase [Candidatus Hydrogenedentes bacterium]|nr:arylsulfatase [Candidatus Hydrogenedentota bacterium]HOL77963.1 arylsulfatase [Candidatus Hydrogenedentota bacterium]
MPSKMNRRNAVKNLAVLGSGIIAAACNTHSHTQGRFDKKVPVRKPNIIFILADDLGYGDLGCYGQEQIQTPNLDTLAAEGVRFTQCYSGSTVCAPSRCALMTGLHTGHCRIRGNDRVPLEEEDVTVAEVLKQAGYRTGIIGKWGLGEPDTTGIPNRQGFDYWFGYLNQGHAHNYYPEYLWRNTEKVFLKNREDKDKPNVSTQCEEYSHDLFTREALEFVEREKEHPFFLYLAYTLPHANNERGVFCGDGMEVPDYGPYADKPWPTPQKGHAAMITRLDRDVGLLIKRLRELGLADNTIVFFTSDNGPHKEGGADPNFFKSSGPLRGFKRDLYEGGIRVPMIVWGPGSVPKGVTRDTVWAFWDFLPTAAAIAGVPCPKGLDGVSVASALFEKDSSDVFHDFLYWEFHENGFKQAVRMGDWKAVRLAKDAPLELYNLAEDEGETHNVAGLHKKIVSKIEDYLASARTPSEHWRI